uniref:Small ribosomal subunit protein uS10 n=1 Tax=uncultured korarchaeote TaxID=161241 RepID=A0A1L2JKA2_9CREN|nr:ribosomal protein S10 [uncultured korarchaeote]
MRGLRIELVSTNYKSLETVCKQLKEIVTRSGARIIGPVPLPTKKLRITTRRTPCGQGGKTWERWELRIHKRIIDIPNPDERLMRRIMSIAIPEDVKVNIILP